MKSLMRVWIADDSRESSMLLQAAIMESYGDTEVVSFSTGLELLDAFSHSPPPDFLFLDVHMPEISGLAVLERMEKHEIKPGCTVLCSSDRNPKLPDMTKRAGADFFFYKPWGFEELVETVQNLLSQ